MGSEAGQDSASSKRDSEGLRKTDDDANNNEQTEKESGCCNNCCCQKCNCCFPVFYSGSLHAVLIALTTVSVGASLMMDLHSEKFRKAYWTIFLPLSCGALALLELFIWYVRRNFCGV